MEFLLRKNAIPCATISVMVLRCMAPKMAVEAEVDVQITTFDHVDRCRKSLKFCTSLIFFSLSDRLRRP